VTHLQLVAGSKSYRQPDGTILEIFSGVDLEIGSGEVCAVVGRSGSGKSTLLNVLGLLTDLSQGAYLIDGRPTDTLTERERSSLRGEQFGFVFQEYMLMESRTALENVAMPLLHAGGETYRRRKAIATELLDRVGLADKARSFPWQLSGGQQQRVAIARAIARSPQVIFADEPTGSLDVETGDAVLDLLLTLVREQGCSLMLVTHDEGMAGLADRKVRLDAGRLVLDGAAQPS
jgi:putative ABC transport system ATP-binding protein